MSLIFKTHGILVMHMSCLCCAFLMMICLPVIGLELPNALELGGIIGVGHDDNAMREASNERSSSHIPYKIHLSFPVELDISSRLQITGNAAGSFYKEPNQNSGTGNYGLALKYEQRLIGGNRKYVRSTSLDFEVRGFFGERRRSNYSRVEGEEFTVVSEGDTISLKDRFHSRAIGGAAEVGFRWPRGTQWSFAYLQLRRDYLEDYRNIESVDPFDYDNSRWLFRIRQRLPASLRLELEYSQAGTDYESWSARDCDGNSITGISQSFRYVTYEAVLKSRPMDSWLVQLRIHHRRRTDPFQGYYDSNKWKLNPTISLTVKQRWELELDYSYIHRVYDNAHVGFNPVRLLREDFERLLSSRVAYHLTGNGAIFLQMIYENINERNPAYTYERMRNSVGFQFIY